MSAAVAIDAALLRDFGMSLPASFIHAGLRTPSFLPHAHFI